MRCQSRIWRTSSGDSTAAADQTGAKVDATPDVTANAIAPGFIATAMTEVTRADPKRLEAFLNNVPMKRVGQPEELVGPVVFLCSDAASYVTGAILAVDGGFLAV